MRKLFMCIVLVPTILLFFSRCQTVVTRYSINDHFDITDSVNYENCKDLQGIGDLKINITTTKDIERIFNSIQSQLKDYLRNKFEPEFDNGFTNISYTDTLNELLLKETSIRQYDLCGLFGKYKIGDIKLDGIYLLCYNDTLIGIKMDRLPDIIKGIFINKYGTGRGNHMNNSVYYKNSNNDFTNVEENRIWENMSVMASYSFRFTNKGKLSLKESFEIVDNTGKIETLKRRISAIKSHLDREKENRMKETIEMI